MKYETYKADALLLLTALIWGASFVAQRAAMETMGPMLFNGLRFLLGACIILPLAVRPETIRDSRALTTRQTLLGAILAGTILFLGASLQQIGLVYTTAGKAGFITGLYVVIVPLIALFLGQRASSGIWLGALLATTGLYFLSVTEAFTIAWGDLLVLIGALFWALHVLVLSLLAHRCHVIRLACGQFFACALFSLFAAVSLETVSWEIIQATLTPFLFSGVFAVGLGYTLQVVAQRHAIAAHAAIILSLEAVFAALAGWWLLDEQLGSRGILGCALMLAGMLLAQLQPLWSQRRAQHSEGS